MIAEAEGKPLRLLIYSFLQERTTVSRNQSISHYITLFVNIQCRRDCSLKTNLSPRLD